MSTRVVSFRMTEREYNKMMVECHQMGIGSAEWVQQKIAFANYVTSRDQELLENLKFVRRKLKYSEDKKSGLDKLDEIINSL
jgi:hypothetical protein